MKIYSKDTIKNGKTYIELTDDNEKAQYFGSYINKILDVENLIILAGSGTSLTFNNTEETKIAPSMQDLWDLCKTGYEHGFDDILALTNYEKLQEVKIDTDVGAGKIFKPDIELLLSICDSIIALDSLKEDDKNKIQNFVKTAKNTILRATDFTKKIKEEGWKTHNKFIRIFSRRGIKQKRLKLFTTNYDLAFETASSNTGTIIIDGFEYANPSYFNPMWFSYDIVNRRLTQDRVAGYIPNVMQLYKIHGSIDWFKIQGRVGKITGTSLLNIDQSYDPVFIYSDINKFQKSYESPYLDMMSAFLSALQQPKTALLCLGFGFNNKYINDAITMALRTNPDFMLMVGTRNISKYRSSINSQIKKLLETSIEQGDGRIALVDATFEEFVNAIPERAISSPEEQLFGKFENVLSLINSEATTNVK